MGEYLARSFDYIVDLLNRMDRAEPYAFDPAGDLRLRLAKRVRREALRVGGEDRLHEDADRHFGLPASSLTHAARLESPLYPESLSAIDAPARAGASAPRLTARAFRQQLIDTARVGAPA